MRNNRQVPKIPKFLLIQSAKLFSQDRIGQWRNVVDSSSAAITAASYDDVCAPGGRNAERGTRVNVLKGRLTQQRE